MDAQSAVRVAFGVVFLGELAFRKGLRVVLLRVRHDGFSLKSILPKRGSAFYINGVFFGFSHGRRALQLLRFLRFRS